MRKLPKQQKLQFIHSYIWHFLISLFCFERKTLSKIFQSVAIASFCIYKESDIVFLFLFMCRSIRYAIKSNIVQHDGLSDHAFIITSYKKNIFSREKFSIANMMWYMKHRSVLKWGYTTTQQTNVMSVLLLLLPYKAYIIYRIPIWPR